MGLDIYLYKKKERFDYWNKIYNETEEYTEKHWNEEIKKLGKNKYNELTGEESDRISKENKEYRKSLGLSDWGDPPEEEYEECIELPSKKYPDHYFKIGYFRSSYNSSGINSVFRNLFGIDCLYYIFKDNKEEYRITPDWEEAKKKTVTLIEMVKEHIEKNFFDVISVNYYEQSIKNENEALRLFKEEYNRYKKNIEEGKGNLSCYSSLKGFFSMKDPYEVYAVINGKGSFGGEVYLITKGDKEKLEWYIQALEIVIETINYVLEQKDSEAYYLHWSA